MQKYAKIPQLQKNPLYIGFMEGKTATYLASISYLILKLLIPVIYASA
jgi:hypothetical protein